MRLRNSQVPVGFDAPQFDADSREVLADLGYSDEDIERLIEAGVVAESWRNKTDYLPS